MLDITHISTESMMVSNEAQFDFTRNDGTVILSKSKSVVHNILFIIIEPYFFEEIFIEKMPLLIRTVI